MRSSSRPNLGSLYKERTPNPDVLEAKTRSTLIKPMGQSGRKGSSTTVPLGSCSLKPAGAASKVAACDIQKNHAFTGIL